jgi:hypothetical protein
LALFADEVGPGFEDGEDGDDVAGVCGDGAPVEEGDDVEADGCGWVYAFAFDLLAVVHSCARFVKMGQEGERGEDVVEGFGEPASVSWAYEASGQCGFGFAVG